MTFVVPERADFILNKSSILQKTQNGLDIFKHYISSFVEVGKPFSSVFRTDNNPSANIFKADYGEYLYKDFVEEKALNSIYFVKKLKGLKSFQEALEVINKDLSLGLIKANPVYEESESGSFDYWDAYGDREVIRKILVKYNVKSLKSFTTNSGFQAHIKIKENPAFAFKISENCVKVYRPLELNRKFKHQWLGNKPEDYSNVFGIEQLPQHCKTILITEGLKDCIVANANLNHDDIYAVGLDNVSTSISPDIISILRKKCDYLVLCLDIDEKGLEGSLKKSKMYGLRNFILPPILYKNGGKDISDWFKLKLEKQLLINELESVLDSPEPLILKSEKYTNPVLLKLFEIEKKVDELSQQPIVYSEPLIKRGDVPIIRKGTINIIQGRFGSHKSRIGELFCSLLIAKKDKCQGNFLQFDKLNEAITVCYIDTERNNREELPTAIQSIKQKACYDNTETIVDFRFTSIREIPRKKRLEAVKVFIEAIRSQTSNPIFVLLDVVTDCISNFNDPVESMELFDYLGNLCENSGATFMLVIHQNPSSDKARGHIGTEATNKASTVLQIGYEKGRNNEDSELIALKFLKIRSAKRPNPIHLIYDDTQKGLVLAHEDLIQKITEERRTVANIELVSEELGKLLCPSLSQKELLNELKKIFNCSENTIKTRLEEIEKQELEIINERERPCNLRIKVASGKPTIYELQEIDYQLLLDYKNSSETLDEAF